MWESHKEVTGNRQQGKAGSCGAKIKIIPLFYVYIRVLLINTNSMIYIYCIRYSREVGIYVLTVGDNELDVGDNVAASSGVAARGNARETHADRLSNGP